MINGIYGFLAVMGVGLAATLVTCWFGWLAKSEIEEQTSDWHLAFAVLGFLVTCAINGYAIMAAAAYR